MSRKVTLDSRGATASTMESLISLRGISRARRARALVNQKIEEKCKQGQCNSDDNMTVTVCGPTDEPATRQANRTFNCESLSVLL